MTRARSSLCLSDPEAYCSKWLESPLMKRGYSIWWLYIVVWQPVTGLDCGDLEVTDYSIPVTVPFCYFYIIQWYSMCVSVALFIQCVCVSIQYEMTYCEKNVVFNLSYSVISNAEMQWLVFQSIISNVNVYSIDWCWYSVVYSTVVFIVLAVLYFLLYFIILMTVIDYCVNDRSDLLHYSVTDVLSHFQAHSDLLFLQWQTWCCAWRGWYITLMLTDVVKHYILFWEVPLYSEWWCSVTGWLGDSFCWAKWSCVLLTYSVSDLYSSMWCGWWLWECIVQWPTILLLLTILFWFQVTVVPVLLFLLMAVVLVLLLLFCITYLCCVSSWPVSSCCNLKCSILSPPVQCVYSCERSYSSTEKWS